MTELDKISTEAVEAAIGIPKARWAQQCHVTSLAIVKSDIFPLSRVARGTCKGVGGQHSWVVIGNDCYAPDALIMDPTLWSYDDSVDGIWWGTALDGRHKPFGWGNIWGWGRPFHHGGKTVTFDQDTKDAFSREARDFLAMLEPLDIRGWAQLASDAPVGGWPAKEILTAMRNNREMSAFMQIDRVGMVTDLNPGGLYLR